MLGLIDPPTPFSLTERWETFLHNMRTKWPQDDHLVQSMIQLAEHQLESREKAMKPWWTGGQRPEATPHKVAAD